MRRWLSCEKVTSCRNRMTHRGHLGLMSYQWRYHGEKWRDICVGWLHGEVTTGSALTDGDHSQCRR